LDFSLWISVAMSWLMYPGLDRTTSINHLSQSTSSIFFTMSPCAKHHELEVVTNKHPCLIAFCWADCWSKQLPDHVC
jgi:hypothetical protein